MPTKKTIILITAISFFFWACKAQNILPSQENLPRIENVHFKKKTDTVNVYYDLLAESPDTEFNIDLMLSLGDNKTYKIDSTSTSGDIGNGVLPGKKKEIAWKVLDDFPQGIQGKQIQFIVDAQKVNSKNNNKWLYITGGAVLLGASAILGYLFLLPKDDGGLPSPPSRPGGN